MTGLEFVIWWWIATTSSPCSRSPLRVGVTSVSNIATSPATAASSSVPTNAAQVLSPMRALMVAPISFRLRSSRPSVIL